MKNRKVYFFTRSYLPEYQGGGAIVREQTVSLLKSKGYSVVVVLFTTDTSIWKDNDNIIPIKVNKKLIKYALVLEHLGLVTDYLSPWINKALTKLTKLIDRDDILFATSGGELGCIELAIKIKEKTGSKLLINLHDPIDHSIVLGERIPTRYHKDRTKKAYELLAKSNAILTSSQLYAEELKKNIDDKDTIIKNWYFGYSGSSEEEVKNTDFSDGFNLVYAGNMNNIQQPHILLEELVNSSVFTKINFHFFGSGVNSRIIEKYSDDYKNIFFHGQKSQSEIHSFYINNAHAGFIPLIGDYFKPFVPSKLYDYIKFGLPVLAFLPDGDASSIINKSKFGFSSNDISDIEGYIESCLLDEKRYSMLRKDILDCRYDWSIDSTSKVLFDTLDEIN